VGQDIVFVKMNIYDISSGDSDPNYDLFGLQIAMDGDSNSTIRIYNSGGAGVIQYGTQSDYIYSIQRVTPFRGNSRSGALSQVDRVGYPEGFAWIPGRRVSSLSAYSQVGALSIVTAKSGSGNLPSLITKENLSTNNFLLSGIYVPSHHYDDPWVPSGKIRVDYVDELTSNRPPLITVENSDIETTGKINIQSTNHEGSIVLLAIRPDFTHEAARASGNLNAPLKFGAITSPAATRSATLREWNSLFNINDGCNVNSVFKSGENRDTEFTSELANYLSANWYSKLQEHLWGDYIQDSGCSLFTRDPRILKNVIFYQLSIFGTSNDILELGIKSYPDNNDIIQNSSTLIRWHFGLDGYEMYGNQRRFLYTEDAWIEPLGELKSVSVVGGLPPRQYCSYLIENNQNLSAFKSGLSTINSLGGSSSVPTSPY
jgi:hypothetical protein